MPIVRIAFYSASSTIIIRLARTSALVTSRVAPGSRVGALVALVVAVAPVVVAIPLLFPAALVVAIAHAVVVVVAPIASCAGS
jgi:hypothetical protein